MNVNVGMSIPAEFVHEHQPLDAATLARFAADFNKRRTLRPATTNERVHEALMRAPRRQRGQFSPNTAV